MKKINLIFLILVINIAYSQKKSIGKGPKVVPPKTIEKLSYEDANNIEFFRDIKNYTRTLSYEFEDGNVIKAGDTIRFGEPSTESSRTRTAAAGYGFVGGATSNTKTSKEFEYLTYGKPGGFGNVMLAMGGETPSRVGTNLKGDFAIISELILYHKGSRKKPLKVFAIVGEINGRAFGMNKYITVNDLDNAWSYGEILMSNVKMTRADAINKLKEAKELMDIEMMTREEFDKLKEELGPIIKGSS
mgnify:FL=1|tara:strand:- start:100 stop:834 length:735 start_codon:yes stop_codon:yes gene_type:complete